MEIILAIVSLSEIQFDKIFYSVYYFKIARAVSEDIQLIDLGRIDKATKGEKPSEIGFVAV